MSSQLCLCNVRDISEFMEAYVQSSADGRNQLLAYTGTGME